MHDHLSSGKELISLKSQYLSVLNTVLFWGVGNEPHKSAMWHVLSLTRREKWTHIIISILKYCTVKRPNCQEKKNVFEIEYLHEWFIFSLFRSDSQVIPKPLYKCSHTPVFFSLWEWENLRVCSLFLALYFFSWIIFRGNIDVNILWLYESLFITFIPT